MIKSISITLFIFLFSVAASAQTPQTPETKTSNSDTHFIGTASVGAAFRIASSPKGLGKAVEDYVDGLKSGISYDASVYYRIKQKDFGFGVKFNAFNSSGTLSNQELTDIDGTTGIGSTSDAITITFIGASYIIDKYKPSTRHEFNAEVALGYMGYKDDSRIFANKYKITGSTLGMDVTVGYKYRVFKNFSLGPQVGFLGGVIKKFDVKGSNGYHTTLKLDKDNYESLWRIDLSLSAIYRF